MPDELGEQLPKRDFPITEQTITSIKNRVDELLKKGVVHDGNKIFEKEGAQSPWKVNLGYGASYKLGHLSHVDVHRHDWELSSGKKYSAYELYFSEIVFPSLPVPNTDEEFEVYQDNFMEKTAELRTHYSLSKNLPNGIEKDEYAETLEEARLNNIKYLKEAETIDPDATPTEEEIDKENLQIEKENEEKRMGLRVVYEEEGKRILGKLMSIDPAKDYIPTK